MNGASEEQRGTGGSFSVCVGCDDATPCRARLQCVVGACLSAIGQSACATVTCDPDESCHPLDGSCYPSNGRCSDSSDCRPGHTCSGFLDVCLGCSTD